jgi:F-type H+-transporting ATPase subunit delta
VPYRRVAARYAEALFAVAQERYAVEAVREELADLVQAVDSVPELRMLLARPDLPADMKLAAVRSALGDQVSATVSGLLDALVRHGRGELAEEVAEAFGELADDAAGVVRAEARSVVPLTPEQRRRLVGALARTTGRRVELEEAIDPSVLAGVRLWVGDRLIDGSAAGRLERLREQLISVRGMKP